MMKRILGFLILILLLNCTKNNDDKVLYCDGGFEQNIDNTECICIEETHFLFSPVQDPSIELCLKKNNYIYKAKVIGTFGNCTLPEDYDLLKEQHEGLFRITTYDNIPYPSLGIAGLKNSILFNLSDNDSPTLTINTDGTIEYSWRSTPCEFHYYDATHLEELTDAPMYYCKAHGISNTDNTELVLSLQYFDSNDVLLATGSILCWKDY